MPGALSSLLWFAAVVATIPLALWLLRRTPLGGAGLRAGGLRSVAVLPLAPGQRVVTVEVGMGSDRRWLVLGVTAQSITALHTMAPQDDGEAAGSGTAPSGASPSFAQLLGRLGGGARRP